MAAGTPRRIGGGRSERYDERRAQRETWGQSAIAWSDAAALATHTAITLNTTQCNSNCNEHDDERGPEAALQQLPQTRRQPWQPRPLALSHGKSLGIGYYDWQPYYYWWTVVQWLRDQFHTSRPLPLGLPQP